MSERNISMKVNDYTVTIEDLSTLDAGFKAHISEHYKPRWKQIVHFYEKYGIVPAGVKLTTPNGDVIEQLRVTDTTPEKPEEEEMPIFAGTLPRTDEQNRQFYAIVGKIAKAVGIDAKDCKHSIVRTLFREDRKTSDMNVTEFDRLIKYTMKVAARYKVNADDNAEAT